MTTPTLRRLFAGAFAASCLAGLPVSAVHAVGVIPVTDTVTDLYLDWSFAIGDSGVLAPYVGSYWLAEILPSWTGGAGASMPGTSIWEDPTASRRNR